MAGAELYELRRGKERWTVVAYARPRPDALLALTPGELAVFDLWVDGLSMRELAERRGVTVRTVAKQIASVYAKLRVSSREELVAWTHANAARRT